ncbi:MAG TPA: sigma 54-interacting transcriptional regulator [Polyangia bacterium]|nr:sigma 54-interacting transcriptional regulator [Polyangia bacterium]
MGGGFRLRVEMGLANPRELMIGDEPVVIGTDAGASLVLHDPGACARHCEIVREGQQIVLRDLGSRTGTWLSGVRVREVVLGSAVRFRIGCCEILFGGTAEPAIVPDLMPPALGALVGDSAAMRLVLDRLARIAERDTALLLEGESGTGKELAAQGVHDASARARGPFVVVDCGSIARSLIESELFGHERGAYTGASQAREGAFVNANGGTLFLDEIGELDLDLQPRLLGAIERREVKPIGGARPVPIDLRIIAATNRDLRREVARGRFREDLYYRLAVARVRLPPLRERLQDLPLLIRHFLRRHEEADGVSRPLDELLHERFVGRPWPGNIRELRNAVERMVTFGFDSDESSPAHGPSAPASCAEPFKVAKARLIGQFEQEYLSSMLAWKRGNITAAASAAEMDRVHMVRLLDRYGLRRKRER